MADDLHPFSNLDRLSSALKLNDPRINEIISLHVALERELELALEQLVRRSGQLRQLGHANSIKVYRAFSPLPDAAVEPLVQWLDEFNRLRNAVAHGDAAEVLDRHIGKMRGFYATLGRRPEEDWTVPAMVAGIFGFLAGHPGTDKLKIATKAAKGQVPVSYARKLRS